MRSERRAVHGAPPAARLLLAAALAGAVGSGCGPEPVSPQAVVDRMHAIQRPNLVLVIVDTLRADATTPYEPHRGTTPELQAWASRGVVFESVLSQSSWTKMSMASMMTSLWPASHGLRDAEDGLAESAVTLAELLHEAGYATYAVQTNGWLHQSFGFHQGFDRYVFPRGTEARQMPPSTLWPHADRVVEEAGRLLVSHDPAQPFFLYLHFMDVHEYAAPREFRSFGDTAQGHYLAAARWVDDAVARVVTQLSQTDHLDRTVVVIGADHGETFGEHGVHGHARNVLTPVLRVPLIFRFPFPLEPPLRVSTQVRNVDLAPTLLELAGVELRDTFEGSSLMPLLADPRADDRPGYAALGTPLFPDASVQSAVNDGHWTYARNAEAPDDDPDAFEHRGVAPGAEMLFDRSVDPGENVDLAKRHPEETARMRRMLEEHRGGAGAPVVDPGVRIDPEIENRLRAMGYLR